MSQRKIAIFQGKKIRRLWDKEEEKRLRKEGSEAVTNCHQLMISVQ